MTRALLIALLALFAAWPAMGVGKNKFQSVMTLTEVSTAGGLVTATVTNPNHATGYLVIKTENETATASLSVQITNSTELGTFVLCTLTAITTDTTTIALLGSDLTAADGITDACDWPMSRRFQVAFAVSGAGADFDITADMMWVTD